MKANQARYPVATACGVLGVSTSGYYAWLKRKPSARATADAALVERIRVIHARSTRVEGPFVVLNAAAMAPDRVEEELFGAERQAQERVDRLVGAIMDAMPEWSLAKIVTALMAVRGIDLVAAVTIMAELGDLSRFASPRELMAYLGLVPSEHSSGRTRRQGGITKAGNGAARRMLIEAAWSYRFPARIAREQLLRQERLAKPIRDIAWKAQERLCRRYRKLARTGKQPTVITAAIARELAGFIWAIGVTVERGDHVLGEPGVPQRLPGHGVPEHEPRVVAVGEVGEELRRDRREHLQQIGRAHV